MKVVESKLPKEILEALDLYCFEIGVSRSEIIRFLITSYMDDAPRVSEQFLKDSDNLYEDQKVHITIPYYTYVAIRDCAKLNGISVASEIRFRLHKTLSKRMLFRESELEKLYSCAVQLRKVGVNLNFIAKGINNNQVVNFTDEDRKLFDQVKNLLSHNMKVLETMLNDSDQPVIFKVD